MSEPYVGEIRMAGFNFAPQGWARCDGSLMSISENEMLFYVLGTTYGGDGQTTFALPDFRGRVPLHQGQSAGNAWRTHGESGGSEAVTLSAAQLPVHTHALVANASGVRTASPSGNFLGSGEADLYNHGGGSTVTLAGGTLTAAGGGQPHANLQPFLCINFIIALYGIFPTQN